MPLTSTLTSFLSHQVSQLGIVMQLSMYIVRSFSLLAGSRKYEITRFTVRRSAQNLTEIFFTHCSYRTVRTLCINMPYKIDIQTIWICGSLVVTSLARREPATIPQHVQRATKVLLSAEPSLSIFFYTELFSTHKEAEHS